MDEDNTSEEKRSGGQASRDSTVELPAGRGGSSISERIVFDLHPNLKLTAASLTTPTTTDSSCSSGSVDASFHNNVEYDRTIQALAGKQHCAAEMSRVSPMTDWARNPPFQEQTTVYNDSAIQYLQRQLIELTAQRDAALQRSVNLAKMKCQWDDEIQQERKGFADVSYKYQKEIKTWKHRVHKLGKRCKQLKCDLKEKEGIIKSETERAVREVQTAGAATALLPLTASMAAAADLESDLEEVLNLKELTRGTLVKETSNSNFSSSVDGDAGRSAKMELSNQGEIRARAGSSLNLASRSDDESSIASWQTARKQPRVSFSNTPQTIRSLSSNFHQLSNAGDDHNGRRGSCDSRNVDNHQVRWYRKMPSIENKLPSGSNSNVILYENSMSSPPRTREDFSSKRSSSYQDHLGKAIMMIDEQSSSVSCLSCKKLRQTLDRETFKEEGSIRTRVIDPETASITDNFSPIQRWSADNKDGEVYQGIIEPLQQQPKNEQPSQPLRKIRLWYRNKIAPYWKIMVAQVLCSVYIIVLTFSPSPVGIKDPTTNNIIDPASEENTQNGVLYMNGSYRPIVAIGVSQKVCLAVSRISAFSMYPLLVISFITKMKAIQTFLSKTPLYMHLGVITKSHEFHEYAGKYIAFDVWLHALFHILRWHFQGNMKLLWTSAAGISGLIAVSATPLIAIPMMTCKDSISYEIRKGLHYLFYLFAVALCFHVPPSAIPNGGFIAPVLGFCLVLYTLDALYTWAYMTEKIETTAFSVLSSGVRISLRVSERFQKQAGKSGYYVYINLPWINDKQWHPFSLFEDPKDPAVQQIFLMKNGDWTEAIHRSLSRDTTRPCWIKGPFPSPYSHASSYDNQILVASGIGITPALAAINAFKSSRRINLIWAVRDPEMLEFFLEHMYLDHNGENIIFYTGSAPLASSIEGANANIRVRKGRPQLPSLIPNVIYGYESGIRTFSLWEEREDQKQRVKQLNDHVMSSWGIMYCGGSKGLLSSLQEISIDYNVDLHVDSFAW